MRVTPPIRTSKTITGPDDLKIEWTVAPEFEFETEVDALRTLDLLSEELDLAREQVRQVMRYMSPAVIAARAVTEGGDPVTKQAIIGHSGLARQTVYDILGAPGPGVP
jgi:hypothetical protein